MAIEPADFLHFLRVDGDALGNAARSAPEAPIASCPKWDMSGLLTHVGGVHEWVEQIVSQKAQAYLKRDTAAPEGSEALLAWYQAGLDRLLDTLGGTDVDEPVWNWRDRGPAPAAFWFRRMANETAIHRWDAEAAAAAAAGGTAAAGTAAAAGGTAAAGTAAAQPVASELAVDGIDEYLSFVALWLARSPVEGLAGSLHLHATDVEGEWSLQLQPDHLTHTRSHAKADAAIRGPVSDLLLWMVNRVPADSPTLQLFGDPAIVAAWGQLKF